MAVLCIASIVAGRHLFPAAGRPVAAAAAPATRGAGAAGGSGLQVPAIEARADAGSAEAAAERATGAAQSAQALLSAAAADLRTVTAMASAEQARQPGSEDPAPLLAVFSQTTARIRSLAGVATAAERQAAADADAVVRVGSGAPGAAGAATAATSAARQARVAVAAVRQALDQSGALSGQAQGAVAAWRRIHAEPRGYFGVQVANPPSGSSVPGCEVLTVEPGSPAAAAGLTGGGTGATAAGDVIAAIADSTDGGREWTVPDCTAFSAAMAQTRAGDDVAVVYDHRRAAGGGWQPGSAVATLATASAAGCPAALTGTLPTAPGANHIRIEVGLSGPAGGRSATVLLEPQGRDTILPDALLRSLGYRPRGAGAAAGVGGTASLYRLPGEAMTVADHGSRAALATGTLTVIGVPGTGTGRLGRGILRHGARFATTGGGWTLTPPCS